MRSHLLSFVAGSLIGLLYFKLGVASPAPPAAALVGLLGILLGEQILPVAKRLLDGSGLVAACRHSGSLPHLFGDLPGRHARPTAPAEKPPVERGT